VALADLASRQSQAKAAGFSKISDSFLLQRMVMWLGDHLPAVQDSMDMGSTAQGADNPRKRHHLGSRQLPQPQSVTQWDNHIVVHGLCRQTLKSRLPSDAGCSVSIRNCVGCYIYILGPVQHVNIVNCHRTTVVLGAVRGVVSITSCRRVELHAVCGMFRSHGTEGINAYLCCAMPALLLEGTIDLTLAPFATFYSALGDDMAAAGLDPAINEWDRPVLCGLQGVW